MIRRLALAILRSLATAAYNRLPEQIRMQLALDWVAESDRYVLGIKTPTNKPWPANVRVLPVHRAFNAECLFADREIGR